MNYDHYLSVGDTNNPIRDTLSDESGVIALAGCTVTFVMRSILTNTVKVSASATVVSNDGQVRYDFTASDVDTPGTYVAQWVVTFVGGKVNRFPNNEPLILIEIAGHVA